MAFSNFCENYVPYSLRSRQVLTCLSVSFSYEFLRNSQGCIFIIINFLFYKQLSEIFPFCWWHLNITVLGFILIFFNNWTTTIYLLDSFIYLLFENGYFCCEISQIDNLQAANYCWRIYGCIYLSTDLRSTYTRLDKDNEWATRCNKIRETRDCICSPSHYLNFLEISDITLYLHFGWLKKFKVGGALVQKPYLKTGS